MNNIDKQIEFMELQAEASKELWIKGYETFDEYQLFEAVLETLKELKSNALSLQSIKKKCPGCGEMFTPNNQAQETCSGKCRVRLHRSKNKLKEFNAKVSEILKSKDEDAKFTVEQKLVEDGKCPFVVTYKGDVYKAENTKSLLTQLKKI